jgi:hypothetical protein
MCVIQFKTGQIVAITFGGQAIKHGWHMHGQKKIWLFSLVTNYD